MVRVSRIVIFPFKSFDGVEVDQVRVLPAGGLEHDRRFVLITADGRVVNGKRTDRVHQLVIVYDRRTRSVDLSRRDRPTDPVKFHLDGDREELELWLSEYFETPVAIVENADSGFPDDTVAFGPTFITTETLRTVASWFAEMTLDEARRRFRANIELEGEEVGEIGSSATSNGSNAPFWEDRFFATSAEVVRFRVGTVCFEGTNPCARCVVPMRDSISGKFNAEFRAIFKRQREATLPAWANRSRFDHFYRLAVNSRPVLPLTGTTIRTGDRVDILETVRC